MRSDGVSDTISRRDGLRLIAGGLSLAAAGCAGPGGGTADSFGEAARFELPGRAVDHLGRAGGGFRIWQRGERMAAGGADRRGPALSISKAVAGLALARAIREGWATADGQPDFPEWRGDGRRKGMTLRYLVHSTAGVDPGAAALYRGIPENKGRIALGLPQQEAPGSRFRYGPAPWEVLAEWFVRALSERAEGIPGFFHSHVALLGLSPQDWRADRQRVPFFSTGLQATADDLTLFGAVLGALLRGEDQAGLSAAVVRDLASAGPANPMFSAGMWFNRQAARRGARAVEPERVLDGVRPPAFWQRACLHPAAFPQWVALVGSGGRRIYLLPPADLVIVRNGGGRGWSDAAMMRALAP